MNADSIVVDLEHARSLREAGWEQNPTKDLFSWIEAYHGSSYPEEKPFEVDLHYRNFTCDFLDSYREEGTTTICYAAPTAEEILRRLPECLHWEGADSHFTTLRIAPWAGRWSVEYRDKQNDSRNHTENADTLANAASKMWCYLKKNNLLPDLSSQ